MLEYGDKGDLVCLGLMRKRICAELDLLRLGTGVLTVVWDRAISPYPCQAGGLPSQR